MHTRCAAAISMAAKSNVFFCMIVIVALIPSKRKEVLGGKSLKIVILPVYILFLLPFHLLALPKSVAIVPLCLLISQMFL